MSLIAFDGVTLDSREGRFCRGPLLGALDRVLYVGGGRAVLGAVCEIITGPVLSRLYGSSIEAEARRHDQKEPVHVRL